MRHTFNARNAQGDAQLHASRWIDALSERGVCALFGQRVRDIGKRET